MHGVGYRATQVGRDFLAVDDAGSHVRFYRPAAIFSSVASNWGASPAMVSRLTRAVAPVAMATSRGGTSTALAISLISAPFASPSLGGAATRTLSTARPSAVRSTPSMASHPPLGVNRTTSVTPPGAAAHGLVTRRR